MVEQPPSGRPPAPPAQPAPPGPYGPPAWPPGPLRRENVLGIIGLICSILGGLGLLFIVMSFGFFFFIGLVSLPLSIAGMVCGLLGRQRVDRGELSEGRGVSQAAFIVGLVALILHLIGLVLGIVLVGSLIELFDQIEWDDRGGRRRGMKALETILPILRP